MTRPRNIFPGWLCYAIVVIGIVAMLAAVVAALNGCAALDRAATAFKGAATQPSITIVVPGGEVDVPVAVIPYGEAVVSIAAAAASLYLFIRGQRWKSAFRTVVNTVEPFIPDNLEKRQELEAAQGVSVTAKVKAVKA